MATNTIKARLILNNKTAAEWVERGSYVGLKGELLVENDTRKCKLGDGVTPYSGLSYLYFTTEEVQSLITAANHTHKNQDVLDETTASFTTELLTKLNGIATGANKTTVDSALNSSSTNPVQNKVVQAALDAKVPTDRKINGKALTGDVTLAASDVGAIDSGSKGVANGVASLDSTGKVPSSQLPSYVDDVLEGYYADGKFYKDSDKASEYSGETGKIYVDLTTNKTYRWSGSAYVVISETLALGTTSSTAYRGDYGDAAYKHSQAAHAPADAEKNIIVGVQKNGEDVEIGSDRKVNIAVPIKVSELSNDKNFIDASANVASASMLETARNFSITGGATAEAVSFNGTENVAFNVTALDATKLVLNSGDTLVLDGSF